MADLIRRTETATGRAREFGWDDRNLLAAVTGQGQTEPSCPQMQSSASRADKWTASW